MRLRRRGNARTMAELAALEPDPAGFIMGELSPVNRDVLALGGPPQRSRRVQRRLEALALACVTALRAAHDEPWRAGAVGTPLEDPPSLGR